MAYNLISSLATDRANILLYMCIRDLCLCMCLRHHQTFFFNYKSYPTFTLVRNHCISTIIVIFVNNYVGKRFKDLQYTILLKSVFDIYAKCALTVPIRITVLRQLKL